MSEPEEFYIEQLRCGPMQNFVYLVGSRSTREVAIVDPAWAIDGILEHIEKRELTLVAALVTHYHQDHIGGEIMGHEVEGLAELLERRPSLRIYAHREEASGVAQTAGIAESEVQSVDSQDTLRLGEVEIEFLHTPGHTPGSQCFMARGALVSGDTLFIQGCGRVDLPGADPDQMYASLQKLNGLPEGTVLFPGHDYGGGPHASLGETRQINPYLRIPDLETWRQMMGGGL
ncbi:MAG: MBL fold metallo-hydrolase [Proteobacteria bacterium]|nr:MBL fold metallo-hydrolase [Pseudomonadota bacterium]